MPTPKTFDLGFYRDLMIVVWFDSPTMRDFDVIESETEGFAGEQPDGFGILVVIVAGNDKPPPNDVRHRNADLVARYSSQIWGMARVVEGVGLKASMVRFALSTIDLLTSSPVDEKTFDAVKAATSWLQQLRPGLNAAAIERKVADMKARAPERRPAARKKHAG